MNIKRFISVIISLVFTFNLICLSVSANDDISRSEMEAQIRSEIMAEYLNDPQFMLMCSQSPATAEKYITNEITKRLLPQTMGSSGPIAYCTVPLIQQPNSYYCGYASMLMSIYGFGRGSSVSGNTDTEKQTTLAKMQSTNGNVAAVVYKIVDDLNSFVPNSRTYAYTAATGMSKSTFSTKVYSSLYYDRPVILHAYTGKLSYYQGVNSGHYVVISSIDQQHNTVTVVDPHYNSTYYGNHTVTIDNALSSIAISTNDSLNINNDVRYLISL